MISATTAGNLLADLNRVEAASLADPYDEAEYAMARSAFITHLTEICDDPEWLTAFDARDRSGRGLPEPVATGPVDMLTDWQTP